MKSFIESPLNLYNKKKLLKEFNILNIALNYCSNFNKNEKEHDQEKKHETDPVNKQYYSNAAIAMYIAEQLSNIDPITIQTSIYL